MATEEKWISAKEAAFELGVAKSTAIDLTEKIDPVTGRPFLKSRRPAARKIDICRESLERHLEAVSDPLFWSIRRDKQRELDQATRDRTRPKSKGAR